MNEKKKIKKKENYPTIYVRAYYFTVVNAQPFYMCVPKYTLFRFRWNEIFYDMVTVEGWRVVLLITTEVVQLIFSLRTKRKRENEKKKQ